MMGRKQILGTGKRHPFTAGLRCRRPLPGNEPLLGQEPQNRLAIGLCLINPRIAHAAQLQGRCQVGRGNGRLRKRPGQPQPGRRTGLIERTAARVFTQQRDTRLQARRQRLPLRPVLRQRIEMNGGFKIAVQVQGDVGVTGMTQQQPVHGLQL
ncbi:hypothetical protein D3C84_841750 [compost metagenome]